MYTFSEHAIFRNVIQVSHSLRWTAWLHP